LAQDLAGNRCESVEGVSGHPDPQKLGANWLRWTPRS